MSKSARRRARREAKAKELAARAQVDAAAPKPPGGRGEEIVSLAKDAKLEGTAIRRPHLYGLTQQKREGLGIKNMQLALAAKEERVQVAAARNVLAMQRQEMEQSKTDAGGDHLNLHVDGEMTEQRRLELVIRIRDELADIPGAAQKLSRLLVPHANGSSNGHAG